MLAATAFAGVPRMPPRSPEWFGARGASAMTFRERQLLEALKGLMNYVGGWDADATHPCGVAAKTIKEFGGPARFADLAWTAADVQTLATKMTDEEAATWLANNEGHIRDRLVELGWDVIESLLGDACSDDEDDCALIPPEAMVVVNSPLAIQRIEVTAATGYTSMGYPMTPPRTFTLTWDVALNLSYPGGELNLFAPLGELVDDQVKLRDLLGQVFSDDCSLASVDGEFGVIYVQEFKTAESVPGSQLPSTAEVERKILAFMAKEQVHWPRLKFCIPPDNLTDERAAMWVFIPDGALDLADRERLLEAIHGFAYGTPVAA